MIYFEYNHNNNNNNNNTYVYVYIFQFIKLRRTVGNDQFDHLLNSLNPDVNEELNLCLGMQDIAL